MKTIREKQFIHFDAWMGGEDTKKTIIEEGKQENFELLIEELYPNGITESGLNDILWFDSEWVFETLGIKVED
tara:strand:- start:26 stop:244 length:219 start_codon:yes stop_codon:yes gene_type:complete